MKECEHECFRLCVFRSAFTLTSPTCDIQRGSDPLTPAGTHIPLVLIGFGFMLAGQMQMTTERKEERKEIERKRKQI